MSKSVPTEEESWGRKSELEQDQEKLESFLHTFKDLSSSQRHLNSIQGSVLEAVQALLRSMGRELHSLDDKKIQEQESFCRQQIVKEFVVKATIISQRSCSTPR